ncbi:uncharacterized protein LOC124308572 [Neodiprion virginianus]|uniref:uncharacterized protein LOC124308572 n=1 Tax=Neodiprion virginianus TaxID=2961670 RepID=UPI001EE7139B|nr:uncharacterized protein LOC124308572 [Neodiprion virginianus]
MSLTQGDPDTACKVFKCHPNSKVPKIVICLICENVYHEGNFNKYSKGQFLSEMLVTCPKYQHENLTSKTCYDVNTLDENARKIITQIKLFHKEELRSELCNNITLNNSKNISDVTDFELDETSSFKMENELLRQLNAELQARNNLLDKLVEKSNLFTNNTTSYAEITKCSTVKPTEKVPKILVKAKNNNNKETSTKVKMKLTTDLSIPINNVRKNTEGLVSIKCKNTNDIPRVKSVLSEKLGSDYCVYLEHLNLPKIKVINIENNMDRDELCEDIYNRNFLDLDGAFNIIADYKNPMDKRSLIMELTAESYLHLKNNGFKLYVGYQCCHVLDYFNFNLCYKCGRYNHSYKKCNNQVKCLKCAGDHLTTDCKSEITKCLNYVYYNDRYHKNRPANHCATDTCCEYLVFRLNKIINNTDYPVKPLIPNSVGKLGNKSNPNSQ